jgi:hypothetical protein
VIFERALAARSGQPQSLWLSFTSSVIETQSAIVSVGVPGITSKQIHLNYCLLRQNLFSASVHTVSAQGQHFVLEAVAFDNFEEGADFFVL